MQRGDKVEKGVIIVVASVFAAAAVIVPVVMVVARAKPAEETFFKTRELQVGDRVFGPHRTNFVGKVEAEYEFPDGTIQPGVKLRDTW